MPGGACATVGGRTSPLCVRKRWCRAAKTLCTQRGVLSCRFGGGGGAPAAGAASAELSGARPDAGAGGPRGPETAALQDAAWPLARMAAAPGGRARD